MSRTNVKAGMRFGRWTVIAEAAPSPSSRNLMYSVRCACGGTAVVSGSSLRVGSSKSCGCLRSEATAKLLFVHGFARTKIYKRWKGIRARCLNPKHREYNYYGGRGITISKRWGTFEQFYKDMGDPPFVGASIDRVNNDRGYSKSNCRWATAREQQLNKGRAA